MMEKKEFHVYKDFDIILTKRLTDFLIEVTNSKKQLVICRVIQTFQTFQGVLDFTISEIECLPSQLLAQRSLKSNRKLES